MDTRKKGYCEVWKGEGMIWEMKIFFFFFLFDTLSCWSFREKLEFILELEIEAVDLFGWFLI